MKYTVILASNGRSYQIETVDAKGDEFTTTTDYSDAPSAYAAAEAKGWKPDGDDVLARRIKHLGY